MEKFESTDDFIKLLESGQYPRAVMENDDDALASLEACQAFFESCLEHYKSYTARSDCYDYFVRRQMTEESNDE
jgi:hypothetical protein